MIYLLMKNTVFIELIPPLTFFNYMQVNIFINIACGNLLLIRVDNLKFITNHYL
ncbi:Uncharacterised protein [Yersinia rohdei]|nr:Uncharacterised protein [Yersinia rohdei]